jgi:hypothetical protein
VIELEVTRTASSRASFTLEVHVTLKANQITGWSLDRRSNTVKPGTERAILK